jgi:hypothetical protein
MHPKLLASSLVLCMASASLAQADSDSLSNKGPSTYVSIGVLSGLYAAKAIEGGRYTMQPDRPSFRLSAGATFIGRGLLGFRLGYSDLTFRALTADTLQTQNYIPEKRARYVDLGIFYERPFWERYKHSLLLSLGGNVGMNTNSTQYFAGYFGELSNLAFADVTTSVEISAHYRLQVTQRVGLQLSGSFRRYLSAYAYDSGTAQNQPYVSLDLLWRPFKH